ncbi:hypothetical protein AMTR_s00047p00069400 [Amborella trichopoda]|uniref:Uncharacterized protein n=1 Tax=Amborella trichopoda TaxID=13333 RepID=U5DBE9_AMBTC|nr:hypothetical protein AMTR_s00047p00069400 [Amborella trichopoda]
MPTHARGNAPDGNSVSLSLLTHGVRPPHVAGVILPSADGGAQSAVLDFMHSVSPGSVTPNGDAKASPLSLSATSRRARPYSLHSWQCLHSCAALV